MINILEEFAKFEDFGGDEKTIDTRVDYTPDNSVGAQFVDEQYQTALDELRRVWGEPTWEGEVVSRERYLGPKPWPPFSGGYFRAIRAAWWWRHNSWWVLLVTSHDGGSIVNLCITVSRPNSVT